MSPREAAGGLTLVELLVAVALALVILLVAGELLVSSSRSASDLQGRNELLEESQIAQNYLVAQLREAVYLFPAGRRLNLGPGDTTRRPGGGAWEVGDPDWPLVALVRPPRQPGGDCPVDPRSCYQFLAYYPLPRGGWVDAVSGPDDPGPDSANAGRWVLVEFRADYPAAPTAAELESAVYAPPRGSAARLLLDYVQPRDLARPGTPALFEVNNLGAPGTWTQAPGKISVGVNLAVSRRLGGRDVTVPSPGADAPPAESVTTVVATPRNLGNLP